MKLIVEDVMSLERASVNLLDNLTAEYLYIAKNGQIGRSLGAYAIIREKLEEVARITEAEMAKKAIKNNS